MSHLNIRSLVLKNFRCFESLEIDFHEKLTVLIARNGGGKTAILDAIALALVPFVIAFADEIPNLDFNKRDIRLVRIRETETNEMEFAEGNVSIQGRGKVLDISKISLEKFNKNRVDENISHEWVSDFSAYFDSSNNHQVASNFLSDDIYELNGYARKLFNIIKTPSGSQNVLPIVAYYRTSRLWEKFEVAQSKLEKTSRTIAYFNCLNAGSNYKAFSEWFRYWTMNIWKSRIEAAQAGKTPPPTEFDNSIDSVVTAVNKCLERVSGWHNVHYSIGREELVAERGDFGVLPISGLSDGIRNMIAMVADIAFRATKLNPHLKSNAALETPGIVLIDEVDLHLHPEWQQVVLQNLSEAFPKIQFIVTTHSPQVISTVPSGCLRVIQHEINLDTGITRHFVEIPFEQTRGVASSSILASVMGVDPVPQVDEASWLSEYKALIQQGLENSANGLELREKIVDHFGDHHAEIIECERLIRLESFKRKWIPPVKNDELEQG